MKLLMDFSECGLRSPGVSQQIVTEKTKKSEGSPYGNLLVYCYSLIRQDMTVPKRSDKPLRLELDANVMMITGDQLSIGIETGRRLGTGTHMNPSSSLLGN
ncbi:hypothetical protein DY000_02059845 [Brassica cretica]|uniref:Uncharacterized protein n=1 Tax=Brassica cretica TaxID=69181 RepID=A0ABQ7B4V9_BRACR|nr:hypothetical protein DY000_02059845 [Brassica cretica]